MTGLSRSTIDRVLNDRPGVRSETRQRVEKALDSLGYAPSSLSSWRAKKSKSLRVLVPQGTNPFFAEIRKGIQAATRRLPPDYVDIQFEAFDPYKPQSVQELLQSIDQKVNAVITLGADNPHVEDAIRTLEQHDIRVVTVVSDVPNSGRTAYVGQNNFIAGRTAARLMLGSLPPNNGTVAVMLGHLQFRHLLDRQSGFQQVLGMDRPDLDLVVTKPYGADPKMAEEIVRRLLNRHEDLVGVYLAGGGQPYLIEALTALSDRGVVTIGHELTEPSCKALRLGAMKFLLAHDVYEIGRKAIDALFGEGSDSVGPCDVKIYVAENLPAETHNRSQLIN